MTESEALQDNLGYELEDENSELSEFEMMLEYHGIDKFDYKELSISQKSQMWWNFKKLAKLKK